MDTIHNDFFQKESIKVDQNIDDTCFVCPLCEAERLEKVKAYYAKIRASWNKWHARHGTYRRKS